MCKLRFFADFCFVLKENPIRAKVSFNTKPEENDEPYINDPDVNAVYFGVWKNWRAVFAGDRISGC